MSGEHSIEKYYYALAEGVLPEKGEYTDFLLKEAKGNISRVVNEDTPGAKKARLIYEKIGQKEIDGILYEIKRDDLVKDGWIVLDFSEKEKELIDKGLSMKENNVKILLVSDVYKKYFPKNGNEIIKKVRKFRKDKKYEC